MADLSYKKYQKSHRNRGSKTPVEGARATRGRYGTSTSWANGDYLHSSRGREALRMPCEKYPARKVPSRSFFAILH